MNLIDITGQRFGRLTVQAHVSHKRRSGWRCLCDCGAEVVGYTSQLKRGALKSCGCLKRASNALRFTTHNGSATVEYQVWAGMCQRCSNPKHRGYKDYGGRGIMVCPEWRDFGQFYSDMGPRPSSEHWIERKDNNAGYNAENCVWAHRDIQRANKRNNRLLTHDGVTKPLFLWARDLGLTNSTLRDRILAGWPLAQALTLPKLHATRRPHSTHSL